MVSFRKDESLQLAPAAVPDYREWARRRLPRQLFDYIDGGAYAESTLAANVADLADVLLRQRVLRDVSQRHLETTVLGQQLSLPVILAPVGLGGMFATRAEVAAAKAAESAGVQFCESTVSICSIEEVAQAVSRPPWFQLYVMRDRSFAEGLMARAGDTGCEVLILTVDLPVVGARYRDGRNGLSGEVGPFGAMRTQLDRVGHPRWVKEVGVEGRPLTFGNLTDAVPNASMPQDFQKWVDSQFDPSVTWDDIAWVREHWKGRLVLKGILDSEDAKAAADHGVEGIIVSNHGGRQLDSVPSTAAALPAIAEAVGDELEVLVDGGIRSGLDVVKMLALGAKAALVGRPWAWAVAASGQHGVEHVLSLIREEMEVALALTGVTDVADLSADILLTPK